MSSGDGTSERLHVLVIGAGSVGRRHATNLAALGCRISAVDPREDRLIELADAVAGVDPGAGAGGSATTGHLGSDLAAALGGVAAHDGGAPLDAVVVASPTAHHVTQAIAALEAGLPVLLEKPLGIERAEAVRLRDVVTASGVPLLLGYTWRWWPALQRVRTLLAEGAIGEVRHLRCTMSAHLADWHPWERYQDFFMASRELGGGALLDESHWIDLAVWLLGAPVSVLADVDRISDLEIDTDDNVDLLLRHVGGARSLLHLDLHGRPHERSLTIVGSEGTLHWTDQPDAVRIGRGAGAGTWTEERFTGERNDMFVAVARELLDVVAGRRSPSCGVEDGLQVLRVIDAARRSHADGRRVALDEVSV
jgi:predicted dehydrogenase